MRMGECYHCILEISCQRSLYNSFLRMPRISYYLFIFFPFFCLAQIAQARKWACSTGCLACPAASLRCTACDQGYQLTGDGRCLKTDGSYNCDVFLGISYVCLRCKPTFRLLNGTCVKDYSGCLEYSNQSCVSCGFGRILSNGSCSGILNCRFYDPDCKYCESGFILNSNRCFYVQRDCVKVDVASGACSFCAPGFRLVGFRCFNNSLVLKNCNLYNHTTCISCKAGFGLRDGHCVQIPTCNSLQFLNDSFQCEPLPLGCSEANSTTQLCLSCFPNYKLFNQTCLEILPQNCLKLSVTGECNSCKDRFYAMGLGCQSVSRYCQNYYSNGRCKSCSYEYFANYGGVCQDPFCLNSTLDSCLACRQLYRYDNSTGRCLIADPRCINASDTVCWECSSGYYASKDVCLQLPASCLSADRAGACLKCRSNYFMQFDQCFATLRTIAQCVEYDQYSYNPRCVRCEVGYFVSLGNCRQIPPYCSLFLSDGKCVMCVPQFKLVNARCEPTNSQNNLNCVQLHDGACVRCASRFALGVNNVCYRLSPKCMSSASDGSCMACGGDSVLSRGACLLGSLVDVNCKLYEGPQCKECYAGYYLGSNACKLPNIDCRQFDTNHGGCTSCFPGYTLTNRQCVVIKKIENCQAYDGKGNCIGCAKFFYLNSSKCEKVSPLCRRYNDLTGACTGCFGGFQLQRGSCIQKALVSWFNPANESIVTIETCRQYNNQTGKCAQCIPGYFLQNSRCINFASLSGADPSCKLYLNLTYCSECFSGFVAINGNCKEIDPLCRTANATTGECTSCYQGYALEAGKCNIEGGQFIDPCLEKLPNSTCAKCLQGYTLQSGNCIFNETSSNSYNVPFCQIAVNSSFCSLCSNGFYARNGICYQVSSFCLTYDPQTGNCLTCKDSYIFSEGRCVSPALGADPFCQSYAGVYCSRCEAGYYLSNYVCTQIDVRCTEFNFEVKQCLKCSSGVPLFASCQ